MSNGNCMPKEQHDFIVGIENYIAEATNYENPWEFAFRIWQNKEWLYKYLEEHKND